MRHRLHPICPYFAMFPETFVREHLNVPIRRDTGVVFDPFSGRGTTILESLLNGRAAAGMDINPVAYCVTGAKAHVPPVKNIHARIDELEAQAEGAQRDHLDAERAEMHPFFRVCFYHSTLRQILVLRDTLNWRRSPIDRFIAALALGCLHGERGKPFEYFSNQMPRTISTKPDYSVRYWRRHRMRPPKRDVFGILRHRLDYRLGRGRPPQRGSVRLGDSRRAATAFPNLRGEVSLVITSPPYFDVTSFEEDQWLRLWFLGHHPRPTYGRVSRDDRHTRRAKYWQFLCEVWAGVAPLMRDDAVLVCRMGGKNMDGDELAEGLLDSLRTTFGRASLRCEPRQSELRNRQTGSFRPGAPGCRYEWDYVVKLGPPAA